MNPNKASIVKEAGEGAIERARVDLSIVLMAHIMIEREREKREREREREREAKAKIN